MDNCKARFNTQIESNAQSSETSALAENSSGKLNRYTTHRFLQSGTVFSRGQFDPLLANSYLEQSSIVQDAWMKCRIAEK
jgi:hypothetical protein